MYQEKIKVDWVTIWLWFGIMIFGWLNIYAAGYDADHAMLFDFSVQHGKQFIWMSIATLLALFIVFTEPRVFSNTAYPIYGIAMALLVVTLFVATVTKGAISWINLGPFKFQPSEFAKFATALAVAKYLSTIGIDMKELHTKLVAATLIAIPAALILLQHDTGSALVFLASFSRSTAKVSRAISSSSAWLPSPSSSWHYW